MDVDFAIRRKWVLPNAHMAVAMPFFGVEEGPFKGFEPQVLGRQIKSEGLRMVTAPQLAYVMNAACLGKKSEEGLAFDSAVQGRGFVTSTAHVVKPGEYEAFVDNVLFDKTGKIDIEEAMRRIEGKYKGRDVRIVPRDFSDDHTLWKGIEDTSRPLDLIFGELGATQVLSYALHKRPVFEHPLISRTPEKYALGDKLRASLITARNDISSLVIKCHEDHDKKGLYSIGVFDTP